ncbi:M23 family metallopeptidase [Leifsonia sp. AG29]|uniref:M23 family metallopeptidase n=1 Tax=Leifsonia sp. AG29 TaxID=2598860 RepID=UPI001E590C7E|nr:M23 family metallopeptidase [Leifsonia sp. AG29]
MTANPVDVQQAAQLATDLASAQQELADASDAARAAEHARAQAQAAAEALTTQADAARKKALASAAYATALLRTTGAAGLHPDPLSAALTTPGDLLTKLGAVNRLNALAADRNAAIAAAVSDRKAADRLDTTARQADAAVGSVDTTTPAEQVAAAQGRVDSAAAALASLPTVITAGQGWSSLTVDPSLIPDGWALPVHGSLTDGFGPRPSRPAGTAPFHPGDDIGAACGTTIFAAAAGTVVAAGPNGSYGNFILIDHGGAVRTAYGHIRDGGIGVTVGEQIAAGQAIAQVGTTGASTGCHLHFEVRVNGVQIDPLPFMAARGIALGTR